MHFRENAEHLTSDSEIDITPIISNKLEQVLSEHGFIAGFLCTWDLANLKANVISTFGIPQEPFKGSKSDAVSKFINSCINTHCATHLHKISDTELWHQIRRVTHNIDQWRNQVLFVPAYHNELDFVLLGFSSIDSPPKITDQLKSDVLELTSLSTFLLTANQLAAHSRVTEIYIREIGHDLASSVQAIIAKLRNVSRGLLKGEMAITKVREAEYEMMSAYRTADTLGVTIDPDYNLSTADWFEIRKAVNEVIALCKSEAGERHIEIRAVLPERDLDCWGDKKAIQSAMTQLLLNGIKYARGSSVITTRIDVEDNQLIFTVINRGVTIEDEERLHVWDFGWRGKKAKEMHVNGSGIGLYTVQKIARAHGGKWGSTKHATLADVSTFYFTLPMKRKV